jgi:catalase
MKHELYKEYPGENEAAELDQLIELTLRTLRKKYLTGPQLRDTHAKGLAVVRGTFTIDSNLPADLRVGLFKEPKAYKCILRFSNTDPNPKPDLSKDMRAVSIKLFGVEGNMLWQDQPEAKTMDLLLMSAKTFITPDLKSFIQMQEALLHAYLDPIKGNAQLVAFFAMHPSTANRVAHSEIHCANVLELPYFSETAFSFGEKAVQYKLVPHKPATSHLPDAADAPFNYLNERLRADLAAGEAVFDFMVQFQVDAEKMPIEDSAIPWDETLSPPVKVATLTLHKQEVEEPALVSTGEHLSFNPWRTLPEHRPLGWTNRVRNRMYVTISEFRHKRNSVPVREPSE